MKQDSILSMLGLAKRAGKLVSGEFATETAVRECKARLVIIATDASNNTKKLFTNKCDYYHIPCREYSTKDQLGHAIGTEIRTSVGIVDEGLATSILKKFETVTEEIE